MRIRAIAATASCAVALVALDSWTQPLMAQGTVSEYAKTPAAPSRTPPATTQAPAQNQAQAVPLPAQRQAAGAAAPAGKGQPAAPSPVGSGSGWRADVQPGAHQPPQQPQQSGEAQAPADKTAAIQKVNAYFNGLKSLHGAFLQTESDNSQKKGKFYIERPGKIRFDYSPPSMLHIISDGEYLAIEDHDLSTTDRYPLDSTPFRLLLSKDVDLIRDARILGIVESDSALIIALEDKSQSAGGQIRLFFSKPDVQLKEWIITDPQGLNTKISISDVEVNKDLAPNLFQFSDVGMPRFSR